MRIGLVLLFAAALPGSMAAGCAGEGSAEPDALPVVDRGDQLGAQAVREVVAVRTAGAEAGVVSTQIFAVISAAGQQPPAAGRRTLRRELPPLLAVAAAVWPRSSETIAGQAPRSEAARLQRAILLRAVRSEQASLARLRRELRPAGDPWPAVLRFGRRSDELRRRLAGEIDAMMAAIPANESEALRRAFAGG
ncbi:MAG: hypothetical protein H0V94_08505 [Actinobacteria bacterium]|nr:hypothetical protein [Actinomycetota bacterium]